MKLKWRVHKKQRPKGGHVVEVLMPRKQFQLDANTVRKYPVFRQSANVILCFRRFIKNTDIEQVSH